MCVLCPVITVTLHVLTVDTGRVWAAALITRTFISQTRGDVSLQISDCQLPTRHSLTYRSSRLRLTRDFQVSSTLFLLVEKFLCISLHRHIKMHRKAVIFALSFLTISAYPLHRDTREATWTDSKANQAHGKTDLTKDVDNLYKSHLDSSSLYNKEDDHNTNPMVEEMQRKLIMESERLRTRLRQELAELQVRLSPSPARLSSTLASLRELLAPLSQQLQSSLSSITQELCGQLSLYLQDLDTADARAEVQAETGSAARHQETFHWMTQALDGSSSKLANVITDFHSKTAGVIERFTEISANEEDAARSDGWQVVSSRLGQEVSSLRVETQNMAGALKVGLAALLETSVPSEAEVTASVERFCRKAASLSQVFQIQMEKLFQEPEEQRASSLSPFSSSSSSTQPAGSLQEDFSVKLSALIHDILHSV